MRISDFTLIDDTNLINTTNTEAFQIEHLIGFSLGVVFTGSSTLTGNFILQASNDDLNWSDLASDAFSGTSGNCMFNVSNTFYKSVRLKIQITTGTLLTVKSQVYTKGW